MQYAASHDFLCENMVQVKELMALAVFSSSFVSRPDIPGCNTFHGLRPFSPSRLSLDGVPESNQSSVRLTVIVLDEHAFRHGPWLISRRDRHQIVYGCASPIPIRRPRNTIVACFWQECMMYRLRAASITLE